MQLSTMYLSFIKMVLLGLVVCSNAFGQIYDPDPYKIKFDHLDIEHTKAEVITNKIKSVHAKQYRINKDRLKKEIPKSDFYTIEFNEAGNPVTYQYKNFRATADPKDEISEIYNYFFEYDTAGNLIHINEYESQFFSRENHYEKDVCFVYDGKGRLIEETVSKKHIYDPGYTFRGRTIPDDTSLILFSFNYDAADNVTVVFRNEYSSYLNKTWLDTLIFNCAFDSVFIDTYVPRGVKIDKEGRVVENTRYAIHALLKGGGCISPDSPNDVITKFYYNNDGKLIKSESRSRKGQLIRKKHWTYNEQELLQSIQVEKSDEITMYEYEFY